MPRLILTSSDGYGLTEAGLADLVIPFVFRFVWGPLPSQGEFTSYLGRLSAKQGPGHHWTTYVDCLRSNPEARRDLGLLEFCESYETIELWFDPEPNNQLLLIWLLDYFSAYPEAAAKLKLALIDFDLITAGPEYFREWEVSTVDISSDDLRTGSMAWQAYRAPTPQACFDLLSADLTVLPLLRPTLVDLLEELPSNETGLGASEMWMLELIAKGYDHTSYFPGSLFQRRVFNEWERGALLEGLGLGPTPAVAGLDEALRKLPYENYRGRDEAYKRSTLSLTEFGWDVVAHKKDFSQHNPIHRWWGGTELTNGSLWRWSPVLMKP